MRKKTEKKFYSISIKIVLIALVMYILEAIADTYSWDWLFLLAFQIPLIAINALIIYYLNKKRKKIMIPLLVSLIIQFIIYSLMYIKITGSFSIIIYAIIILILLSSCIVLFTKQKRRKVLEHYNYCLNQDEFIDSLLIDYGERPTEFEKFVADLMTAAEYKNVKVTPAVNDGGKDITAVKDNNFYVVEVKLYNKDNKIGREKIQKLHSAMIDSNADKAIFVTTSDFTLNAVEYAEKYNIQTINGEDLYKIYLDTKSE